MQSTASPAPHADEARFGRGAWLTLLLALMALVGPLIITLAGAGRPTDGRRARCRRQHARQGWHGQ